jgi:hypothetical protein
MASATRPKSTKPCRLYQQGNCPYGKKCNFQHVLEEQVELCKFFLRGNCSKGDTCTFRHEAPAATENASPPTKPAAAAQGANDEVMTQSEAETAKEQVELCKFFLRGNCSKGAKCTFRHEAPAATENASPPTKPAAAAQGATDEVMTQSEAETASYSATIGDRPVCESFAQTGECTKGSLCPLGHIVKVPTHEDDGNALSDKIELWLCQIQAMKDELLGMLSGPHGSLYLANLRAMELGLEEYCTRQTDNINGSHELSCFIEEVEEVADNTD